MPLLERRQQIAVKAEVTEGTAVSVAAADAAINTFEVGYTPDIQQYERNPNRATIGSLKSLPGVKLGRVTFTTEVVGSGVTDDPTPPFDAILLSCGYQKISAALYELTLAASPGAFFQVGEVITGGTSAATGIVHRPNMTGETNLVVEVTSGTFSAETITGGTSGISSAINTVTNLNSSILYRPDSSGGNSATIGVYQDGLKHVIKGARGNIRFSGAVGEPMQMQVEYIGAFESTADATLLTGVAYPTLVPPQLLGIGFAFDSYAPIFENLTVDTGNSLQPRRNANDASGVISTRITSRTASGNIDPESTVITATQDWFLKLRNSTESAAKFTLGSGNGNAIEFFMPRAQYANISGGSRNEILTNQVDLRFNEGAGGDDEIIMLFPGAA